MQIKFQTMYEFVFLNPFLKCKYTYVYYITYVSIKMWTKLINYILLMHIKKYKVNILIKRDKQNTMNYECTLCTYL